MARGSGGIDDYPRELIPGTDEWMAHHAKTIDAMHLRRERDRRHMRIESWVIWLVLGLIVLIVFAWPGGESGLDPDSHPDPIAGSP